MTLVILVLLKMVITSLLRTHLAMKLSRPSYAIKTNGSRLLQKMSELEELLLALLGYIENLTLARF